MNRKLIPFFPESSTLAFNGTQHMTVLLGGAQGSRTQTEELILRFKTGRPMGLLLVTSADSNSPDRLEIALVAGRIRASVRLGEREKVRGGCMSGHCWPLTNAHDETNEDINCRTCWPAKAC